MRVIVSCQMDTWKLPHVNSPLNSWCEEYHYDNTLFAQKLRIELCAA